MLMTEMWDSAEQVATEQAARQRALAVASVGGFEPYLDVASSVSDLDNRLAMIAQPIEASVLDATGDTGLVSVAHEHLREHWKDLFDERGRTAAAQQIEESIQKDAATKAEYNEYLAWCKQHGWTPMSKDSYDDARHIVGPKPKNSSLQKGAPFAGYKDFADCVSQNQDKDNPEAYCGSIKHKVEDTKKSSKAEKPKTAGTGDYARGVANGKRDRESGNDPQGVGFGKPGEDQTDYEHGYWEGYGKKSAKTATEANFFQHDQSPNGPVGGPMGAQPEWDAAAAATRDRRERFRQQQVPPVQPGQAPTTETNLTPDYSETNRISSVTAEIHAPYYMRQRGDKWVVVDDVGEVKGTHDTKDQAREQQKALYWAVPGASEMAERKHRSSLQTISNTELVEAHLIAEDETLSTQAFFYDEGGHPYAHPYGPSRRTREHPDVEPPGSRTFHLDLPPGSGGGSAPHQHEVEDQYEKARQRERARIQREHGITSSVQPVEAGFVDRLHRFLEREHATGNLSEEERKIHEQSIRLVKSHAQEARGERSMEQSRDHPKERSQYQHVAAGEPDYAAMFPHIPAEKRPSICPNCSKWRNAENCPHCDAEEMRADLDKKHRGPTIADWLMFGLFPSGATALKTAVEDDLPEGYEADVCATCGGPIVGKDGRWIHDPRKPRPSHPGGSVAGDAHAVKPLHKHQPPDLPGGYYPGHHAVNESAYGTERYQAQPTKDQKAEWTTDEWGAKQPKQAPLVGTEQQDTGHDTVHDTRRKQSEHTGATFTQEHGQADEFAQMRTPVTTRPRVHPQGQTETYATEPGPKDFAGPEFPQYGDPGSSTTNTGTTTMTYTPVVTDGTGQTGQSGNMGGGSVDYSAPTFAQQVAAKVGSIAHQVVEDNPHLSMEQARAIALQALSTHPGVVATTRDLQAEEADLQAEEEAEAAWAYEYGERERKRRIRDLNRDLYGTDYTPGFDGPQVSEAQR